MDYNTPGSARARNTQLKKALSKGNKNGIQLALSSPYFELWYLLHFEYTTKAFKNYNDLRPSLTKHEILKDYQKNNDVYMAISKYTYIAINNAKSLKAYHNQNGVKDLLDVSISPYTNLWELIELLTEMNKSKF